MHLRRFSASALLAATLALGACGGSDSSPTSPSPPATGGGTPGTGTTATLSTIASQIFSQRCTGCHGGSAPSQGLNLGLSGSALHAALVNAPSTEKQGATLVVPGNPDASYLVQKLRGDAGIVGLRMPRNGPPFLTDDQINLVRQWIQAGALNN